jgi:endonuclease-3
VKSKASFQKIIADLEKLYGRPKPPKLTDPLEMILWENVIYLADDERREKAFQMLKQQVGTKPQDILAAPDEVLFAITSLGILPDPCLEKLRKIAVMAIKDFQGDLHTILTQPFKKAKQLLQKFPSIGEPGAEKILLFSRSYPVLALDSNGLRALLRLGFGEEKKNYSASYKSAQTAVQTQCKEDYDWLIRAHQLLRQHGQELCKRSQPQCEACPLAKGCAYYQKLNS